MSRDERTTPRPLVEAAGSYSVPRAATPVELRLDANEAEPPPRQVFDAARDPAEIQRYPDKSCLEAELADFLGCRPEQVLATAGGDEAIDRVCRAFLNGDRNLVMPTPSFVMISNSARLQRAEVREVAWDSPEFPLAGFHQAIDENTGVVALVSPNNPNGFVASPADVKAISEAAPHALILLDLAYIEFADHDSSGLAFELPNVVGVRTFSKARGLAGIRVGYAFGDERWISVLRAAGGPYPISGGSIALALASLRSGERAVLDVAASVADNRLAVTEAMELLGLNPRPSQGNFVFADVGDGARFRDAMAGMGIAVRAWPDDPALGAKTRVTVPAGLNDCARLEHALHTVVRPQAIIFDVDGVLCDVRGSYRASIVQTCRRFDVTIDHDDIVEMKARGDANNDWIVSQRLLAEAGVEVSLDDVTRVFEELYQGTDDAPGLSRHEQTLVSREWLDALRERFSLALVTGRPRRDAERFVSTSGFEGLFQAIVCMEDAPRKPSPEPLRIAMQEMGVQTAWFLGDTVDDIRSARAARVLPIGVVAPGESRERLEPLLIESGAGVVWDSANELERWLP